LYFNADPNTHSGSFFGNAIADWTGVVVTVIATKYFYEIGSGKADIRATASGTASSRLYGNIR